VLILLLFAALAAEPSPGLDGSFERVLAHKKLTDAIVESAELAISCMAKAVQTNDQRINPAEVRKSCAYDAEVDKATRSIKSTFPDISDAVARETAQEYLAQLVFWALLSEGTGAAK
jgi:hypothetical protein